MEEPVKETPLDEMAMPEFKAARDKGVTAVAEPEAEPKTEDQPEEKPKSKGGFQKRIDRLHKIVAEAEKRAEAAEKRAKDLESSRNGTETDKTAPVVEGEPKLEDYTTHEDWVKASIQYGVRQGLTQKENAERQARQNESIKEIFDAHNERVVEARSRIEDFDEVISGTTSPWRDGDPDDIQSSRAFQLAIYESENGPDVAYYLASNPEEFAKLGDMTPTKVQREVWRLSEKLGKAAPAEEQEEVEEEKPKEPAKPVSKAPTPIRPVTGGSTKSSKRLDELSMPEYKKARAAGRTS